MRTESPPATGLGGRRLRRLAPLAALPIVVIGASWWLTEPLEQSRPAPAPPHPAAAAGPPAAPEPAPEPERPAWPGDRLEGEPAKEVLLAALLAARDRLAQVPAYTATFRKQERLHGKLGPEHTLAMKVRHEPFSIYLKFLAPKAGKEVVYAEGSFDNHVIAHNGDWTRRLVPRLKVAPTDPLALADSRHPVTDAGLLNLTDRLIGFRELDLADEDAVTILDRVTDREGRPRLRSIHTHPHRKSERPFAHVEVLYDPDTFIPCGITSFDWPEPGHEGPLDLAESYHYDDVDLDAVLTDRDFDPANPEYAFTRF